MGLLASVYNRCTFHVLSWYIVPWPRWTLSLPRLLILAGFQKLNQMKQAFGGSSQCQQVCTSPDSTWAEITCPLPSGLVGVLSITAPYVVNIVRVHSNFCGCITTMFWYCWNLECPNTKISGDQFIWLCYSAVFCDAFNNIQNSMHILLSSVVWSCSFSLCCTNSL